MLTSPGRSPHEGSADLARTMTGVPVPEPAWSAAQMIERLGGDAELARQLVTLFLAEYPHLIEGLRTSLAAGRATEVSRAAHAVKGCLANFIESGPHETAFEIERLGREGRLHPAPALLARLEREVAAIVPCMQAFEADGSCGS
jgi:HPt (histidine-containing phosphotransfer) domain-containing protein